MNRLKISDILKICASPFIVFIIAHTLNKLYNPLDSVWWPNVFFHFFGGVAMAISGFLILNLAKKFDLIKTSSVFVDIVLVIAFVMSMAVCWEFYEFISDAYGFSHSQLSNKDTMQDLFMGTIGGTCLCLLRLEQMIIRKRNNK